MHSILRHRRDSRELGSSLRVALPWAVRFATAPFEYHGSNHEGAAMAVRQLRLMLGLFFLFAGVGLLVLRFAVPDAVARFNPTRLLIGAFLALVLAGVNLAKWYAGYLW